MKRHWDWIVVGSIVIAAAALIATFIGWNRTDIKEVRGEVQTLAGESRASSAEILRILFEIKTNTAVTHVKAERNEKDIEKLSSDVEIVKSSIHDLGHKIEKSPHASVKESQ